MYCERDCNCTKRSETEKKRITLSFDREQLLYDIKNYAFVEADILPKDAEHNKHQIFDIAEAGNIDRVTRVLALAHSECVEMLYPYTKREAIDNNTFADYLTEPNTYKIDMLIPKGFSDTTLLYLENLIHEYLVCRVLSDWFSITHPNSYANWANKLSNVKDNIRKSITSRIGKIKRPLKPF